MITRFSFVDVSIRSGDICDRSLKLSEIMTSSAPANFKAAGPPKKHPNVHPCLAAHYVHKFSDVMSTSLKVIFAHTLNFRPIFEFLLPQISFAATHIFGPNF